MHNTEQSRAALARANECRMLKAAFKRSVAEQDRAMGKLMVREAISDPPAEFARTNVDELLRSIRSIGREKARSILVWADLSPRRRIGELTDNERSRLDEALR